MHILGKSVRINVILSIFGFFLLFAGIKSWFAHEDDDENKDFSKSPGAKLIYGIFNVTKNYEGSKFFVKIDGKKLV